MVPPALPRGVAPHQHDGSRAFASGTDTLIAAPTGSGKTLAGFLVCIDRLYRAHEAGEPIAGIARVVYVSPLKALAVDVAENLQRPLAEYAEIARELGFDAPDIEVAVRTGDTTSSQHHVDGAQAAELRRDHAGIAVPARHERKWAGGAAHGRHRHRRRDPHGVARDKRGSHLTLTLERLEALCDTARARASGCRPRSARSRRSPACSSAIARCRRSSTRGTCASSISRWSCRKASSRPSPTAEQMSDVLDRIATHVKEHRTTLVFVNTRRFAERFAHQLGERLGDDVVAAHHGSLSKDRRFRVESRLPRASSSASWPPRRSSSASTSAQSSWCARSGRRAASRRSSSASAVPTTHGRGVPKGILYPLTRDELVECAGLLAAVHGGRLDAIHPTHMPLDITSRRLIAEVAAQDWGTDDLFALVRRADPYRELYA